MGRRIGLNVIGGERSAHQREIAYAVDTSISIRSRDLFAFERPMLSPWTTSGHTRSRLSLPDSSEPE